MKNTVTKFILIFTTFFFVTACCNDDDTPVTEKQGKVNIYIEGDLTNEEAQKKLDAEIGMLTENIYVQYTTQLTEIEINILGDLRDIIIFNNEHLKSLKINGKNNCNANGIYINTNINLINVLVKNIKKTKEFLLRNYSNTSIHLDCYNLEDIDWNLRLDIFNSSNNKINFFDLKNIALNSSVNNYWYGNYEILNFPQLVKVNSLYLWNEGNGVTIDEMNFPNLKEIHLFACYGGLGISELNFPLLEKCNTFYIKAFNNINPTINFPNLNYCENFTISSTGTDSNKINSYLNNFLNIFPINEKNIELAYQTPLAPPTGQGLIDKQTLINQGNNVITD
jgi:hypothetical protein